MNQDKGFDGSTSARASGASYTGRNDVLIFVRSIFGDPRHRLIVLCGGRLEGKTTVLRWLGGNLPEEYLAAYVNPITWPPLLPDEIIPYIVKAISNTLQMEAADDDDFSSTFIQAADRVLAGRRLVLLLDELPIEGMSRAAGGGGIAALSRLKQVMNEWPALLVILALGRRVQDADAALLQLLDDAKFRYLSPMSAADVRLMAEEAGARLTEDAGGWVHRFTGGHPSVASWLSCCLADYVVQKGIAEIGESDLEASIDYALCCEDIGLTRTWQALDLPERMLLMLLAHRVGEQVDTLQEALDEYGVNLAGASLTDALHRLTEMGFVERKSPGGGYSFAIEAFRRWLTSRFPLRDLKEALESVCPRAMQEYDAAHKSHLQGDLREAISGYRRALAVNSNHCAAWLGLAQAHMERDEFAQAVDAFERSYELDRGTSHDGLVTALIASGQRLEGEGNVEAAVKAYRRVLDIQSNNAPARNHLVHLLLRESERTAAQWDLDGARDRLRQASDLSPDDPVIVARWSEIAAQRKAAVSLLPEIGLRWGRREWKAFGGLAFGLIIVGLVFFSASRWATPGVTQMDTQPEPPLDAAALILPDDTDTPVPLPPTATATPEIVPDVDEPAAASLTPTETVVPTDTPIPTDTSTATAEPTPPPAATDTPRPPTATATRTATSAPTSTPTVTPTPTLALNRPQLVAPEVGVYYSGARTRIELQWAPVSALASDEWYGLSVRYRHEGVPVESGAWTKENRWVVPEYFAGQADEPERRYDWDVVVVKELPQASDGTRKGREISPRSETRYFVWR
jgi:tetratricopeptide (TPR) repeat protein